MRARSKVRSGEGCNSVGVKRDLGQETGPVPKRHHASGSAHLRRSGGHGSNESYGAVGVREGGSQRRDGRAGVNFLHQGRCSALENTVPTINRTDEMIAEIVAARNQA